MNFTTVKHSHSGKNLTELFRVCKKHKMDLGSFLTNLISEKFEKTKS